MRPFRHLRGRSIPAWAGETGSSYVASLWRRVYPRVGGGNRTCLLRHPIGSGLSPRGRGKRLPAALHARLRRSIPAWAGETRIVSSSHRSRAVYPRVGGGNVAGTRSACRWRGLSPRGRGKPSCRRLAPSDMRSIPAWAGETAHAHARICAAPVYPRVGGGNQGAVKNISGATGLSPRGRGKRAPLSARRASRRSIPAWAGETSVIVCGDWASWVYPRVGGGNILAFLSVLMSSGLSPRGRGKRTQSEQGADMR